MCHSYVMGMDDSIYELEKYGFLIEKEWDNYKVSFAENQANIWEDFVSRHLQLGYWNEYITDGGIVVFMFHLEDGIKRYVVYFYDNNEVLALCEKLCECKFESIYAMLKGNHFYSNFIQEQ